MESTSKIIIILFDYFSCVRDYADSQFDRGHMVPAADFKGTQKALNSTFTMANICPQYPSVNKGVWHQLESWIRHLLENGDLEEVYVVSGPVFAPVYSNGEWVYVQKTIGNFPKLVCIPTHFYKVVLAKRFIPVSGSAGVDVENMAIAAFLVPNDEDKDVVKMSYHSPCSYLARIDQIEAITGISFFDSMISTRDKRSVDQLIPASRDLFHILNSDKSIRNTWAPPLQNKKELNESNRKRVSTSTELMRLTHLCKWVNCSSTKSTTTTRSR